MRRAVLELGWHCLQSGMTFLSANHSAWQPSPTWAGRLITLALMVGSAGLAHSNPADTSATPGQKLERISHEDAGSRVDEVRVGGQTRQIDVTTKSGMPAYQVAPADNATGPSTPAGERSGSAGTAGRSSWRVLSF